MNTQYRKNLKAVLEASKSYCDESINNLKWELGTYDLSVDNDSNVAYQKTIPSGTIDCMINKIGGMSYKINQLVQNGNFESDSGWTISETNTIENNTLKFSLSSTNLWGISRSFSYIAGHNYLVCFQLKCDNMANVSTFRVRYPYVKNITKINDTNLNTYSVIAEATANDIGIQIQLSTATTTNFEMKCYMLFDLTDMSITTTDVSVATSELLKRGIDINEYQAYNTGSIRDSAITSVVSKDSNNTTLDTYTIDSNIQALNGYGWGITQTVNNNINFDTKKYTKDTFKWTITNDLTVYISNTSTGLVYIYFNKYNDICLINNGGYTDIANTRITDNTTANSYMTDKSMAFRNSSSSKDRIYIKNSAFINKTASEILEMLVGINILYNDKNPVETDISQYITTNKIKVEPNGTLTFNNTYNQAVPSDIDYLKEVTK